MIDAYHCRWDMCSCKHFCFHQKYRPRLRLSTEYRYLVLPSVASALGDISTYDLMQGSVRVRRGRWVQAGDALGRCASRSVPARVVHGYGRIRKHARLHSSVQTRMCPWSHLRTHLSLCVRGCVLGNVLICTSLRCCLCVQSFPVITLPGEWRRAAGCHTGA